MTAVPPRVERFAELTPDELRFRLHEAISLYVNAMRYPKGTAEQRAPMWLAHMLRADWRCVAALDTEERLVGIAYGYRHSFATTALANGVPDAQVAALLGHASTTILHQHYSHLTSQAQALRDALAKVRSPSLPDE